MPRLIAFLDMQRGDLSATSHRGVGALRRKCDLLPAVTDPLVVPADIDEALSASNTFLHMTSLEAESPGQAGYAEAAGSQVIRRWATADGLLALHLCGEAVGSSLSVAMASWLRTSQDQSGGWSSRDEVNADATAMAVVALCAAGAPEPAAIIKGGKFLIANQAGGGFSSQSGDEPRVFATAMSIWALHMASECLAPSEDCAEFRQSALRGCEWLLAAMCSDGGWTEVANSTSTPLATHTGMALFALSVMRHEMDDSRVRGSVEWLAGEVPADPNSAVIELRRVGPQERELRTTHLLLPWVVLGLASHGVPTFTGPLAVAIDRLLSMQQRTPSKEHHGGFVVVNASGRQTYPVWASLRCSHALLVASEATRRASSAAALAERVRRAEGDIQLLHAALAQRASRRQFVHYSAYAALAISILAALAAGVPAAALDGVRSLVREAGDVWKSQGMNAVWFSLGFLALTTALAQTGKRLWKRRLSTRA